jgi:hypothetical protein
LSQKPPLDERPGAAEIAEALHNNLLAAIACGIQWRLQIDHSTVSICAPQPRSEGPLVGELGRRQRMKFRCEQFCIIARYAKGYERAGVQASALQAKGGVWARINPDQIQRPIFRA